jgi:hypothetical protein
MSQLLLSRRPHFSFSYLSLSLSLGPLSLFSLHLDCIQDLRK